MFRVLNRKWGFICICRDFSWLVRRRLAICKFSTSFWWSLMAMSAFSRIFSIWPCMVFIMELKTLTKMFISWLEAQKRDTSL